LCPTLTEIILGYGHENVKATHRSTLEFTKEQHLSKKGDCIIAVAADKTFNDLSDEFRKKLRDPNTKLIITIEAGEKTEKIIAHGCKQLPLKHPSDMVVRKSNYVCSRTLAVNASKSSRDLSRDLVEKLKNPNQKVKITLELDI